MQVLSVPTYAASAEAWGTHSFGVLVSERLLGVSDYVGRSSFGAQFRHSGGQFRGAGL